MRAPPYRAAPAAARRRTCSRPRPRQRSIRTCRQRPPEGTPVDRASAIRQEARRVTRLQMSCPDRRSADGARPGPPGPPCRAPHRWHRPRVGHQCATPAPRARPGRAGAGRRGLQILTELFAGRNYGLALMFITPMALLMGQLVRPGSDLLLGFAAAGPHTSAISALHPATAFQPVRGVG